MRPLYRSLADTHADLPNLIVETRSGAVIKSWLPSYLVESEAARCRAAGDRIVEMHTEARLPVPIAEVDAYDPKAGAARRAGTRP